MAKTETLTLEIEAQLDSALREIQRLKKEVENLRRVGEQGIDVKVDTGNAEGDLRDVEQAAQDTREAVEKPMELDTGKIDTFIGDLKRAGEEAENIGKAIQSIKRFAPEVDDSEIKQVVVSLRAAGSEFDAIEAKAKELGDTLDAVGKTKIKGLGDNLKTARADTDNLTDSARGANSAMANMVGNAAQDLGALSGVAGSAGVAIGQMAEYASDATLAGEGLGSALGSMAKVALPIAGIAIATQLIGAAMKGAGEQARIQAELVDNAVEAWAEFLGITDELQTNLDEVGNSTSFVNDEMVQLGISLLEGVREGDNATEDLSEINNALLDLGLVTGDTAPIDFFRALGEQFALLGQTKQNLEDLPDLVAYLGDQAGSLTDALEPQPEAWDNIAAAVSGASDAFATAAPAAAEWADQIVYAISVGDNEAQIVDALATALIASGKATTGSAREMAQGIFDANETIINSYENLDDVLDSSALQDFATEALDAATGSSLELAAAIAQIRAENPDASEFEVWLKLQQYLEDSGFAMREFQKQVALLNFDAMDSDLFSDLVADVKDGTVDLANFDDVVAGLAENWGISEEAVRQYILQEADKQLNDEAAAAEAAAAAQEALAESIRQVGIEMGTAESRMGGITTALDDLNAASGLTNTVETLGVARDFQTVLEELGDLDLSETPLITSDWNALLDEDLGQAVEAVAALRDSVQGEMAQAFAKEGPEGLRDWAASMRTGIEGALRAAGDFTEAEIQEILHQLGLLEEDVEITIQMAQQEQVLSALSNIVSGIEGIPPSVAFDVQMAINNNDPETALRLINEHLISIGEEPISVDFEADTADAEDDVHGWRSSEEATTTTVPMDADTQKAEQHATDFTSKKRTATINADLVQQIVQGLILSAFLDKVAEARTAQFISKADNAGQINGILNEVARDRSSDIHVTANNAGHVNQIINEVARDRHSTVHVHMVTNPTGEPLSANPEAAFNQLAAEATPMAIEAAPMVAPMALAAPIPTVTTVSSTARTVEVPAAVTNVFNIEVRAAVIGNRYETERVIAKAMRSYTRLNGTRN